MDIQAVVRWLNDTRHLDLDPAYYARIQEWQDWWAGFRKSFHAFEEVHGEKRVERRLFSMRMGKKVCEDWASILLNEKTQIVISDGTEGKAARPGASSLFVQGEDGTGGVLGGNNFWYQGNALVEKAFSSGTGAFVVKLSGMVVNGETVEKSPAARILIDYIPAYGIIPLTVNQNGQIVDVCFASEAMQQGKRYIYLETHALERDGYVVTNEYFQLQNGQMKEAEPPPGVVPEFRTHSHIPLFSIIHPNTVNTYPNAHGLGMSVFAHAIDNLMGVDLSFNNLCRDFKLGGKKVFYSERLMRTDSEGNEIPPDDMMQQLFAFTGELPVSENGQNYLMTEYNPSLRVSENVDGIQAQLDYLSFKVGLGTKHYQFNAGSIVTATQYAGDKQELVQNASKHYIVVEYALQGLVRAILWAGKEILGQPVNPDAQVTVNFEDSYIIDKESERIRDQQEVRDGLMQKWEYRMKWRGENEATAKKMAGASASDDELMGFRGGGS